MITSRKYLISILFIIGLCTNIFAADIIYAPVNENNKRVNGYIQSSNVTNKQKITLSNLDNTPNAGILFNDNIIKVDMGQIHNRLHFKMSLNQIKPYVSNTLSVYLNNSLIHSNCQFETSPEDYWIWIFEPGIITIKFTSINLQTGEIDPETFLVLGDPEVYTENSIHYSYRR